MMSSSVVKLCAVLALTTSAGCKSQQNELTVFYASSLSAVLSDAAELFRKEAPQVKVRLEPSGSQVAARKVSELGMRADIVAVADAGLLDKMMIPSHALWKVVFATNEVVIAHKDHSKATDQITTQNWPDVLLRSGIRLGRADPDTAPIGYQTLMVWQLAERSDFYGETTRGVTSALMAKTAKEHVTHDEAELLALLESRAIDYAFLFRSTAEDHHLKITSLPPEINLSRADLASHYAKVHVDVRMKQAQGNASIAGAPVTYALTMPTSSQHPELAVRFLSMLLGPQGRRLFERRGFHPLTPVCEPCNGLPSTMTEVVSQQAR